LPQNSAVPTVNYMKNTLSNSILSLALGGAVALGILTNIACDDDDNDGTIPVDTGTGGTGGHAGRGGTGGGTAGTGGAFGFGGSGGGFGGGGGTHTAGHSGLGGY
jgi:hypothetical protein